MLFSIHKKISSYFICNCLIFKRAENGIRTRDPQLGKQEHAESEHYCPDKILIQMNFLRSSEAWMFFRHYGTKI